MKLFGSKNDTGISNIELSDVLDEHADALLSGQDNAESLIEKHPDANDSALGGLLTVGRSTYRLLSAAHVEPSREFVDGLKEKLFEEEAYHDASAKRWQGRKAWADDHNFALGKAVGVLAGLALVVHIVGTVVLLVAFIVGLGRNKNKEVATTSTP